MKKLELFIKDGRKEWIFSSKPINLNYLSTHEWKFWTLSEDNNKEEDLILLSECDEYNLSQKKEKAF